MPEKTSWTNRIIAASLAAVVVVLLLIWPFPGLHPTAWNDTAVAAGLMPADRMLPGLGVYLAHLVSAVLPQAAATSIVVVLSKLAVGICVYLAYGAMFDILSLVTISGQRDMRRRLLALRIASAAAALALGCSDPFWCAAQGVSGSLFVVFLAILTVWLFMRLLRKASFTAAVLTLFALAVLCAESPFGWIVFLLLLVLMRRFLAGEKPESWVKFLNPIRMQRTKWSVTFAFLGTLILAVLLECFAFAMMDGLKAHGRFASEFPTLYAGAYFDLILDGANVSGFLSLLGAVVLPGFLVFLMSRSATDEENFLPLKYSVVYFLCGLIAFLQLSPFSVTWFWQAVDGVQVSRTLTLAGAFLSSLTLAWALFVLCVEILCRDYDHIESVLFQGYREEQEGDRAARSVLASETFASVRLGLGRLVLLTVPLALVAIIVWGRRLPDDRRLQGIVHQFVNELIDESEGVKYLFTEGAFDPYLRLEALRRGVAIQPISVMGGKSRREAYLRQLGATGLEDRLTLQAGAAEALGTWVMTKSDRLAECAVQLAFELFRFNHRLKPIVYGALVRPLGGSADAAASSVSRCHRLADLIVEQHEKGVWRHAVNPLLKDRFLFAQFRLAVMSRLRAIQLDPQMKTRESIEEIAYANRLNEHNPSLRKILRRMDWVRRQNGEDLTPREGLAVALRRADFVMARRYAMPVLHQDPDEPNANFALGMSYYVEEQFAKAEEYLKRVLKRSPDEASVYNNLALVYLKTDRLAAAAESAAKALELKPGQAEILDTVRQIEEAQKKGRQK